MLAHNNWEENLETENNMDFETSCPIDYLMPTSKKVQRGASYLEDSNGCPQQPGDAVSLQIFFAGSWESELCSLCMVRC